MKTIPFQSVENATMGSYLGQADKDRTRCPVCRAEKISAGPAETVNDVLIIVPIACDMCESNWTENYELTHYDNLVYKKENENE